MADSVATQLGQISATEEPLRVGVLGLGLAGADIAQSLGSSSVVSVVAAADPRLGARERFESTYGGRTYDGIEGLCGDDAVECVWIATPTHLHLEHVSALVAAGKHVVVEKPLAPSLEQSELIVEAALRAGVELIAGGARSFDPAFLAMSRLIDAGTLGPVLGVNMWASTDWMLRPREAYEVDVALGGGCVLNQAPHLIDVARLLCGGRASSVSGTTAGAKTLRDCPGYFNGRLDFVDGPSATFTYNGYGFFPGWELVPWGDTPAREEKYRRSLDFGRQLRDGSVDESRTRSERRYGEDPLSPVATTDSGSDWVPGDVGVVVVSCVDGEIRQSQRGLYVYDVEGRHEEFWNAPANPRDAEALEMYAAVRHGTRPLHSGEWGVATMEVALGLLESSVDRGRPVALHRQVAVPS